MRLDELTLPLDRDTAEAVLVRAGYTKVGFGWSADVYGRADKDYVLKLFSATDHSYMQYVELAKAHPENPHFPRFRGKMIRISDDYNAVRLERLTPYTGSDGLVWEINCYIHERQRNQRQSGKIEPPSLQDACELIAGLTRNGRPLGLDIKAANIMMRGDTLVLTDPVA